MSTKFEDLSVKDFIKKLKTLGEYTISSQADGLTFYVGLDSDDSLYTSPYSPNKRTKFFYKVSDYPIKIENNSFRAAHVAIFKNEQKFRKYLEAGEAIECQIHAESTTSFGNTINHISLVRPVVGEENIPKHEVLKELAEACSEKFSIKVKQLTSIDGEDTQVETTITNWKIKLSKHSKANILSSTNLDNILEKLENFLSKPNDEAKKHDIDLTNLEVVSINLSKIPMEYRDYIKVEREKLNDLILDKYKYPIKTEIIDKLEQEFGTQAGLLHKGSEAFWIASKKFENEARKDTKVKRELDGYSKTVDKNASLEDRGGLVSIDEERIANLLGVEELAKTQSAKKVFKSFRGSNPRQTAFNFASQMTTQDFYGVRQKIEAIYKYSKKEAEKKLQKFKQDSADFYKNELSSEEAKNSLGYFGQTISGYDQKISDLKKCKSFTDLILMLYEPIIFSLHGKHIVESIIEESNEMDKIFNHMSASDICHAYTANILATQLLLRAKCSYAKSVIRDTGHCNLKTLSPSMSPLNFWGMVVFSPFINVMKGKLASNVTSELKKLGGRVIFPRIVKLHVALGSANFIQDWEMLEESANIITMRLETRSQSINTVIAGIKNWDDIKLSDKNIIIAKVFYYLQQHCHGSRLLQPLRKLATEILTMANKENNLEKETLADIKENLFVSLWEDEMSQSNVNNAISNGSNIGMFADMGTQVDPSTAGNTTINKATPTLKQDSKQPVKFMNGKPIIRRKRDFTKKKAFERYPIKEEEGSTGTADVSGDGATTTKNIAPYPKRLFGKKRIIKRIIPGYTHIPSSLDKFFEELEQAKIRDYEIQLEWCDSDFKGNMEIDPGFDYIRNTYKLKPVMIKEGSSKDWPIVKLIGNEKQLKEFLLKDYGVDEKFVKTNIKIFEGE